VNVAPDGSPVDLYALLPERDEGTRVAEAVPSGGSILELGCGTGRITRQLVRLGYRVTAVDEEEGMLAHVEDAETICARIEDLDLNRRFDAALLASNLITTPDPQRQAFLETCRRHADIVVVEGLELGWHPEDDETKLGDLTSRLLVERIEDGVVHGVVEYETTSRSWHHPFAMRVFSDREELDDALGAAGLRLDKWLDRDGGRWFVAVAA
jgi:SAM-dependent methyltransferase